MLYEINCPEDQVQPYKDLEFIKPWYNTWQMCLNEENTVCMTVMQKKKAIHTKLRSE